MCFGESTLEVIDYIHVRNSDKAKQKINGHATIQDGMEKPAAQDESDAGI